MTFSRRKNLNPKEPLARKASLWGLFEDICLTVQLYLLTSGLRVMLKTDDGPGTWWSQSVCAAWSLSSSPLLE